MTDLIKREDVLALLDLIAGGEEYIDDRERLVAALPATDPAAIREAALQARVEELGAACWRMQEDRDRALGWRDRDGARARYAVEVLQSISAKVKASKLPIAGLILHECAEALAELEKMG